MKKATISIVIKHAIICVCIFIFAYCTIKWAWCSDDAYHAYSMSKNLIDGNGFTPTVGKRVNVSTCPLWTLIVTFGMILFKDEYYVGMVLNLLLSWCSYAGLVYVIFSQDRSSEDMDAFDIFRVFMIICLTILICNSRSFISYTTSGLENALLFFLSTILIIYFIGEYRKNTYFDERSIFVLAFIEGLMIFARMDSALVFAPACIFAGIHIKSNDLKDRIASYIKRSGIALLGIAPFIIWEIFSFFYYGMLVPNTALAKLNTGFPKWQYFERGFAYYIKTLEWDIEVVIIPVSFVVISIAIFGIKKIKKEMVPYLLFALGIVLYMIYIVYIGGDFMMGRHFTNIFWVSIMSISYLFSQMIHDPDRCLRLMVFTFSLIICFIIMLIEKGIYVNPFSSMANDVIWVYTDERNGYIPYTGLINVLKNGRSRIFECQHRGIQWYFGIDWYEERLYDPLLSRLPAEDDNDSWMVGHMERRFPKGYLETLDTGENQIINESLHTYYDVIVEIISGDIFSFSRFKKIILLNFGKYDYLIEEYLEEEER